MPGAFEEDPVGVPPAVVFAGLVVAGDVTAGCVVAGLVVAGCVTTGEVAAGGVTTGFVAAGVGDGAAQEIGNSVTATNIVSIKNR